MNPKKKSPTGTISYKEILFKYLKNDPQEAIGLLRECLADEEEPEVFLLALQDVIEAYNGVFPEELSSELVRLYHIVAENGGERFAIMQKILNAYDVHLALEVQTSQKEADCDIPHVNPRKDKKISSVSIKVPANNNDFGGFAVELKSKKD